MYFTYHSIVLFVVLTYLILSLQGQGMKTVNLQTVFQILQIVISEACPDNGFLTKLGFHALYVGWLSAWTTVYARKTTSSIRGLMKRHVACQ